MIHKVVAYITRGRQLLVFEHEGMPEAGLQVPAGTVDPGEALEDALWREIGEESGLGRAALSLQGWIAEVQHPAYDLIRHYAWLTAADGVPEAWVHAVAGAGEDRGLLFAYRWEPWPPPPLAGRQDECLSRIAFP